TISQVTARHPDHYLGAKFWAILFKLEGGDDGPSGLRLPVTCSVRHAATEKFQISKYYPR
ncbi:hypothetical protein HAX54_053108, partial [Datura stramonium]|nr:hypothetical protein [Datura stramonium]